MFVVHRKQSLRNRIRLAGANRAVYTQWGSYSVWRKAVGPKEIGQEMEQEGPAGIVKSPERRILGIFYLLGKRQRACWKGVTDCEFPFFTNIFAR